ncbi:predicted protein [Phaeodactylum tricornutum CCAP 1055/1]|uniref:Uncharacterized protein n=2 Tax=Phaeodactylum tricornutum TaxID=2850 RepID=B7G8R9_PHATC|nr:predicted protein [Phaeodactylum tricornutum CCAP 1055/1]EEC45092.1 predicted protein [Phaeodactylum tricornutum CCAP 1055/1]|eukprot:XP_002183392.1 predicted protein [Phaeodactylum tricornutum CCAP 1055/1]
MSRDQEDIHREESSRDRSTTPAATSTPAALAERGETDCRPPSKEDDEEEQRRRRRRRHRSPSASSSVHRRDQRQRKRSTTRHRRSDSVSSHDSRQRTKRHRKKSRRRSDSAEETNRSRSRSSEPHRHRDSRTTSSKHRHRKHRKHHGDRDSESSSAEDESRYRDERRRSRNHESKKKSKSSTQKRKHKHRRDHKDDHEGNDDSTGLPVFGKYGLLKPSDLHKMKRSFDVWMAEVQGIPAFNGPKWELQQYFATYVEDYNTATLPHKKYYDYDKWEIDDKSNYTCPALGVQPRQGRTSDNTNWNNSNVPSASVNKTSSSPRRS